MKRIIVLSVLTLIITVFLCACSAIDPGIDSQIKELVKNVPYPVGYNYVYDTGEPIQFGDVSVDYNEKRHPNLFGALRFWDENTGEEVTKYYITLHTRNDGVFILTHVVYPDLITVQSYKDWFNDTSFSLNYIREHHNELFWIRYKR